MHQNNLRYLTEASAAYPELASGKILEIGSFDLELNIRKLFDSASEYVGIDKFDYTDYRVSPNQMPYGWDGVDKKIDAEELDFPEGYFDLLICTSVFEHAPRWRQILRHVSKFIRPGGILLVSFGAEGNLYHGPDPYSWVAHETYLKYVEEELGLEVIDAFFEEERYSNPDCPGGYASILRVPESAIL